MLRQATDDEKRARDELTFPEWGTRLSLDQYRLREERLRGHPWAKERMVTWFWTGARVGEVLASCETFRMDSVVQGQFRGSTYGVASVFTEPALRGKGHATAMMQALLPRLKEQPGRQHASLLFSDVGAALYERTGYVARPGLDRVWPAFTGGDPRAEVDAVFTDADVPREWEQVPLPRDPFVVWPGAGQLDWHLERERAYSELLQFPRSPYCGARAGESRAFWMADHKSGRLMVLALSSADEVEAEAVLRAARRCAAAAGLREVRMYDAPVPFEWTASAERGGALTPREGELAMLAPLWDRVKPDTWRQVMRALWI